MNDIPKWVWFAGAGVLVLLLVLSRSSGGGTSTYTPQTPADGGASDALAASELQAKQSVLSQLVNYAGSVDLANIEAASQARLADIQKELSLAEITAQKDAAVAQAHYAYEATNTAARQATKQSFWQALGLTSLGIANVIVATRGGGSAVGQTITKPTGGQIALSRPVGGGPFGRSFG